MQRIRLWAAVLIAGLVLISIAQNVDPVEFQFLSFRMGMPKAALVCVVFLAGGIVGLLCGAHFGRSRSSAAYP